jgi:hypothetical protein
VSDGKLQELDWLESSAANLPSLVFFNASNNEIKKMPVFEYKFLAHIYMKNNPVEDMDKFMATEGGFWGNYPNV